MVGKLYVISGILGDYDDLSINMINTLSKTDLLFVEEIKIFDKLIYENNISFTGKKIEMEKFKIGDYKKLILEYLLLGKNISIFESSGTACFVDPGMEIVDFAYQLQKKLNFKIIPIPGTGAVPTAISISGFNMDKYIFLDNINKNTKLEIQKFDIPIIYFSHYKTFSDLESSIIFMKDELETEVFIGINLGKKGVDYPNFIIRGKCNEVYNKFKNIFDNKKLPDLVFIFKKYLN